MKHNRMTVVAVLAAIALTGNAYAKKDEDKTKKGVEHRVTALEEQVENLENSDVDTKSRLSNLEDLGEYLLSWDSTLGGADCGIQFNWEIFDPDYNLDPDDNWYDIGRDTDPRSLDGQYQGTLTAFLDDNGCDAGHFSPAGSASDIVAISRGGCLFSTKVANAQAAGYGATVIYNNNDGPFGPNGRLIVRMTTGDGSPFAIPSISVSAQTGFFLRDHFMTFGPRPMTIDGPAPFCSPLNE